MLAVPENPLPTEHVVEISQPLALENPALVKSFFLTPLENFEEFLVGFVDSCHNYFFPSP
jgi:hypothetical protein